MGDGLTLKRSFSNRFLTTTWRVSYLAHKQEHFQTTNCNSVGVKRAPPSQSTTIMIFTKTTLKCNTSRLRLLQPFVFSSYFVNLHIFLDHYQVWLGVLFFCDHSVCQRRRWRRKARTAVTLRAKKGTDHTQKAPT